MEISGQKKSRQACRTGAGWKTLLGTRAPYPDLQREEGAAKKSFGNTQDHSGLVV